jgi:hypothetical protein
MRLSACPAVVDFIRHLFTNSCQFEKFLLDEGVFSGFGKLPIFGRLLPKDSLSSACDNAPPTNRADAQYATFLRTNMPPLRISFNHLVGSAYPIALKSTSWILKGKRL